MSTINQDDKVMKILEVHTINRVVCHTDKGLLTLQIRKGDTKYHLVLDSVPLEPEQNKELMDVLFPKKEMDVPQVDDSTYVASVKKVIKKTSYPLVKPKTIIKKKVK